MVKNLFQDLMNRIKEVINDKVGITDEAGVIIACTDETKIGQTDLQVRAVLELKEKSLIYNESTYYKIFVKDRLKFVAFINSTNEECEKYLFLISMNVASLKNYYDEKFDRTSFLRGVLLESILPGDITIKAKDLHISCHAHRTVFLIHTQRTKDVFVYEIIHGLFPNNSKDFLIALNEENLILIKELKTNEDLKEIKKTADIIIDTLNTESMVKAVIGIGTITDNIADLSKSFNEAQIALSVGSIFESEKSVIHYDSLGLGRLIYQIPENLCKLFLKEVFKQGSFELLDSEYMLTIQKFFENNLNVSETSRQMFVHRNTLVYRLDKIQKLTGLDITKFDDAIIFKFATLIKRYLDKGYKIV